MLFQKITTPEVEEALTQEQATAIYNLFKEGKNETTMFTEDGVSFEHSLIVKKEMKRIESEILSKVRGTYLLSPVVPAELDENGEIVKEEVSAVYYSDTTKTALLESLSSELLDVTQVLEDVEDYTTPYQEDRTWDEFKALIKSNNEM